MNNDKVAVVHPEFASEDPLRSGFFSQTIGIYVDFHARQI